MLPVCLVANRACYAANNDDAAPLLAYSQDLHVDLKNYLEVHVKVVPAGNLILFIYDMDSFCLSRFSWGGLMVYDLQLVQLES